MSFIDTIIGAFVETDEETTDEGPIEEVKISKPVEKPVQPTIQPEVKEEVKEERKTVFIDPDRTSTIVEAPVVEKTEVIKPETKPRDTYEFTPIISPFFGANKEQQVSRVIPKPVNTNKPSRLGTIISPIYGIVDDNKQEKVEPIKVESMVQEDIATFSLDDMINSDIKEEQAKEIEIETLEKTYEEKFTSYKPSIEENEVESIEDLVNFNEEIPFEEAKEEVIEEVKEEVKETEEITYTQEELEKQASIKKVMQEYSEEELFERDNQPTLFDL